MNFESSGVICCWLNLSVVLIFISLCGFVFVLVMVCFSVLRLFRICVFLMR